MREQREIVAGLPQVIVEAAASERIGVGEAQRHRDRLQAISAGNCRGGGKQSSRRQKPVQLRLKTGALGNQTWKQVGRSGRIVDCGGKSRDPCLELRHPGVNRSDDSVERRRIDARRAGRIERRVKCGQAREGQAVAELGGVSAPSDIVL